MRMLELLAFTAVASLLCGVSLGWYLRRIKVWCPRCGDALTCAACGRRPNWMSPARTEPHVLP
jgi:hypothetical protein